MERVRKSKRKSCLRKRTKRIATLYHEYQNLTEKIQKKEDELAQLEQGQETDRYFFLFRP